MTLVTNGQFVTPKNGGYGAGPGLGLMVRGSPCRPVCMFVSASTANTSNTVPIKPQPSCVRVADG